MARPINYLANAADAPKDLFNRQTYLGNQYLVPLPNTTTVTETETPLLYLQNPSTNTISLFCNVIKVVCLSQSDAVAFFVYRNPTISELGTPVTPTNLRFILNRTGGALAYLNPTVSSNGIFVSTLVSGQYVPDISTILFILDPGTSMLITGLGTASSVSLVGGVYWYEI